MKKLFVGDLMYFYLQASLETYAGNGQKETIKALPGSKVYRYQKGGLLYVDCYFSEGEQSFGTIGIWYRDTPLWFMQYHGWCRRRGEKEIITHLKKALLHNYENGVFFGGRGCRRWVDDKKKLEYRNEPTGSDEDFEDFQGKEAITKNSTEVFWHEYAGRLLFPVKRGLADYIILPE